MKPDVEPGNGNRKPPASDSALKRRLQIGYMVFSTLVGIKIAEYLIAVTVRTGDWPYLAILALISAGLIIIFYKHIHQLWDGGKHNE